MDFFAHGVCVTQNHEKHFDPMRNHTFLSLLLLLSAHSIAAPLTFTEHNFSVDIPTGWVPITPTPALSLAAMQSPDGNGKFLISAQKFPTGSIQSAIDGVRAGLKESMTKSGCTIDADKRLTIGDLPFTSCAAHLRSVTWLEYTGGAGHEVYSMMAISKTRDPALDPELQKTVHSFHLLSTASAQKESDESNAASARATGAFLGHVTFWVILVLVVIAIFRGIIGLFRWMFTR